MSVPECLRHHVFVDVETTGLDPSRDEVIEVGAVFVERGQIVRRLGRLFKPSQPLPLVIKRLTGLDDALLAEQPAFEDFEAELANELRGWTVVAHNARFERGFLARVVEEAGAQAQLLDTCELLHFLYPELPSHSLESLVRWAGVGTGAVHRAMQDAEDTFGVLRHALERALSERDAFEVAEVIATLDGDDLPQDAVPLMAMLRSLHRALMMRRPPLELEETTPFLPAPRERLRNRSIADTPVRHEDLEALLGTNGALDLTVPAFEPRESQQQMAGQVLDTVAGGGVVAIEAGTGTGKSMAYLAPTALWAARGGGRVAIAPHTRALQDQLIDKELPRLHEATHGAFGYAMLKGQSNYLCRRKALLAAQSQPGHEYSERAARAYLKAFLRRSPHGEVDKLSGWFRDLHPALEELIAQSRSERDTTLNELCPHHRTCFFHSALAHAEEADVLVVNQSLLLNWPERYPAVRHAVFDEAHELEDVATQAFSTELTEARLGRTAARVHRLANDLRGSGRGLLARELRRVANEAVLASKQLSDSLGALGNPGEELALRLGSTQRHSIGWLKARDALHSLKHAFETIEGVLQEQERHRELLAVEEPDTERELLGTLHEVEKMRAALEQVADRPSDERCDSLQVANGRWKLLSQPVDVGPKLQQAVFPRFRSVTLVSATLFAGDERAYVVQRLGFDPSRVKTVRFDSPFDLQRQAYVVLVTDAPDPTGPEFAHWAAGRIAGIAGFLGGRLLGLFSAVRRAEQVAAQVKTMLEPLGIEVLQGGPAVAQKLARRQEQDGGTVLLGSKALWQGLDVPGPGVSCVFIDKLPLEPKDRPLVEAREEKLGEHGFEQYRLPRALLLLRQGVGRLIRGANDQGVVVVADPGAPQYRAQLYQALQGYQVEVLPWAQARVRLHQALRELRVPTPAIPMPEVAPHPTPWAHLGPLFS